MACGPGATGPWTQPRIALTAGKGYGFDFALAAQGPASPLYLAEAKVAVTPLDSKLRVSGTMGLGDATTSISHRRAGGILSSLKAYFSDWPDLSARPKTWTGLRPMTPDGVPVIGPLSRDPDVLVATGHAMLGISLAPKTGRLIADLVTGVRSAEGLERLALHRF